MAKKICKCAICSVEFDRNSIQAVKYGARRYAHQSCYPEGELVPMENAMDPELANLKAYIDNLYGDKANHALINKQIKKFHEEEHMSYNSICKSLMYFYEIQRNPIEKANGGIGIVPFVEQDARNYYLALYMAQQATEGKSLTSTVREITIKPPKMKGTKSRLLEWEIEDEE